MESSLQTPAGRPLTPAPEASLLADRLRGIANGPLPPEDMLDPALAAILEATGAAGGAICLYDQRHDLLRLAAESGLSDEGCQRLRSVRRGDHAAWDMPLHGLLNRRVYLIESAARNRYVPPLVEPAASVRTIACLPIFAGTTPLASLVLVARAPRVFSEKDVRTLTEPLREVSRMIEAARRRAVGRAGPARTASAPAASPPTEGSAERAELAGREPAGGDPGSAERAAEIERLIARLKDAEAAAAHERGRAEESERERARLAQELEAAAAREARAREELAAALRRSTPAPDDGGTAIERTRAAEEARAAIESAAEEKRRAHEQIEELQASLQAAVEERERLARGVDEARAREQEARGHAEELERRIETLGEERRADTAALTARLEAARAEREAELARLTARLGEADAAAARERQRVEEWEREHERLSTMLRDENTREQQVHEEIRAASERAGAAVREDLERALAATRAAEEARVAASSEAEAARGALVEVDAARRALEVDRDRERAEIERLQAAAAGFVNERGRLEAMLAEADAREESARGRLEDIGVALTAVQAERDYFAAEEAAADAAHARLEEALVREAAARGAVADVLPVEAVGTDTPAAPPAAAPARPTSAAVLAAVMRPPGPVQEAPTRRIVILDGDVAWENAAVEGQEIAVLSPGGAAERVAELAGARLVVNLAAAGALDALGALRAAGFEGRVEGCLAAPGADRALPLGTIDVAARPLDPDSVLAALRRLGLRNSRVLTAGADADALISLRQALGRAGFSVSIGWDGKQAGDLLTMVRPDVLVVELDLPPRAAYGLVAQLAGCDPVPIAILVPGEEDPAAGFATPLGNALHASRIVPLARFLARVVGRAEPRKT